jgi:hypothetical protein
LMGRESISNVMIFLSLRHFRADTSVRPYG